MNLFIFLMINLFFMENISCARLLKPTAKGNEKEKSFLQRVEQFLQFSLDKIQQGKDLDKTDLRKLLFYMDQMSELEKKHKTPTVYWYSRQG